MSFLLQKLASFQRCFVSGPFFYLELARLRESEAAAPRAEVAQRLVRLEQSLAHPLRVHPAGGRALAVSSKTLQGVDELRTLLLDTAFDKEAFPRFGE